MLITKVKYAKLIIENPYPSFTQGTLKQSTAEIQCHNHTSPSWVFSQSTLRMIIILITFSVLSM